MKAAVLENNKFVIKNIPKPILDEHDGGAILKVEGCGLCGSDIVKLKQNLVPDGSVLGHEIVGKIVDIKSKAPFQKGDRVVLGHHIPCFSCLYCYGGSYSMCRHFKSTNIIPGGFSEYIYVSEEHLNNTVFNANFNISDIEASFMEPLGCCIRAVKRANLFDSSKNLILGLGSIGILMGQALKTFGYNVYGCDLINDRVSFSEKLGFNKSFCINNEQQSITEMKKIAPSGFDSVFLTAGSSVSIDFALKVIRDGAKIIVFSSIKGDNGFKNNDIYYRELTVMSSYSSSPVDLEDAINLIEARRVDVSNISTVYSLENINEALNDTIQNKIMKAYIKI